MSRAGPKLFGILNITEDSFSDGGLYVDVERAAEHLRQLMSDGADAIDIGPASSNPNAKIVTPAEEIRRLEPIFDRFAETVELSVDSFRPETQMWALDRGVSYLNDIHGFPHPEIYGRLAESGCRLIVMHSVQHGWKAEMRETDPSTILRRVEDFLSDRIEELVAAGIDRKRIIADPGMGYFLGSNPSSSIEVLRNIGRLKKDLGMPVMISVSRKSFLRALAGGDAQTTGAATLASELFAAMHGVDYIRTHDVRSLRGAMLIVEALGD